MCYPTKGGRALAADYLNLDIPEREGVAFDWAAAMDDTRSRWRNDTPWGGRPCRTYKHYVLSPDPKDYVGLDALRELTVAWAREHFGNFEVAIVYHNDNARNIPHAHVVVNNTNVVTGRRLQDPDPKELKHSLQRMAANRGLSDFDSAEERASVRGRVRPRTLQAEYVRRAEREIAEKGGYSWVADIRARIRVARSVTRSEDEFRGVPQQPGRGGRGQLRQGASPRLGVLARRPPHLARRGREPGARLRARVAHTRLLPGVGGASR